jgi:hypothetical protein
VISWALQRVKEALCRFDGHQFIDVHKAKQCARCGGIFKQARWKNAKITEAKRPPCIAECTVRDGGATAEQSN